MSLLRFLLPALALSPALAQTHPESVERPRFQPAAVEASWTPLRLPSGERTALAGLSYMVAVNEDWGLGPAVFGAARGAYGGFFTAGVQVQRRWDLGGPLHLATSLYVGAGGGVSSPQVNSGGGLMLRPEISLRSRVGRAGYVGLGWSHVRFPSGTIRDSQLSFTLGLANDFSAFSPSRSGAMGRGGEREGLGFDEIALSAGVESLRSGSTRAGQPLKRGVGRAGAELRQYIAPDSWWGLEASGATKGGADGYMEILGNIGQDFALGSENLRAGLQLSAGLGGGGAVDTGSGWLLRAGPTLRWITPWGPSVQVLAAQMKARGDYSARQLRLSLAIPLDQPRGLGRLDEQGRVREQTWALSLPHFPRMPFKDGKREAITALGLQMHRDFNTQWYGTAQAGSAAWGRAGAYSYGLFGLGWKTQPFAGGSLRAGLEALVGAAGGGGVQVGSGAAAQGEAWLQWQGQGEQERWRARLGLGRWTSRGGEATPMVNLSLGYSFGVLGAR